MQSRTALAGAVALAAVLVTAGVAGAVADSTQSTGTDVQSQRTIQTSAVGQVNAEADRAIVRVAIVTSGDDVGAVREHLAANASSMESALTDMGIGSDQIQTAHFDISSRERYGPREADQPTYRAIHSFAVTVEDTGRVGEVIDTAVSNGANEVDGVQFTLSAEKRRSLKEQALGRAMETARGKADAVADPADLTIDGVQTVKTSEFSTHPFRAELAAAGDGGGGTSINSGPVTVTATVTVVYEV